MGAIEHVVYIYNSRFACACWFPGMSRPHRLKGPRGSNWPSRVKRSGNCCRWLLAVLTRASSLYFWLARQSEDFFFSLISTSSLLLYYDVLSCLGWWWRIISIQRPPGFFFLLHSFRPTLFGNLLDVPAGTRWRCCTHRQIWLCNRKYRVVIGISLLFCFWEIFAGGPSLPSIRPAVNLQ